MDRRQKYVRVEQYDGIIIFPMFIEHSEFKRLKPISAGFCYVGADEINCFGDSFSLGLKSMPDDSFHATKQILGVDAALKLL